MCRRLLPLLVSTLILVAAGCSTETNCSATPWNTAKCTTTNSGGDWLAQNWRFILFVITAVLAVMSWAARHEDKTSKPGPQLIKVGNILSLIHI